MFDLRFVSGPEVDDEGSVAMRGVITLGEWSEEFLAPLAAWTAADYERAWLAAAERLVSGTMRVAFLHQFAHPESSHHFCWQAWREDDLVYFQERMLLAAQLSEPFRPDCPDVHVEARQAITAEGERISQWQVGVADIADYVRRRRASPVPA